MPVLIGVGLAVWVGLALGAADSGVIGVGHVMRVSRVLTAQVLVVTGLLALVRRRIRPGSEPLRAAFVPLLAGVALPVLGEAVPWSIDGEHASAAGVIARVALLATVLLLLPMPHRTRRLAILAALAVLALTGAGYAGLVPARVVPAVAEGALLGAWSLMAVRGRRRERSDPRSRDWAILAVVVLTVGEALRLAGVLWPSRVVVLGPGFDLAGALFLAAAAAVEMRGCWRRERHLALKLSDRLLGVHSELERVRERQQDCMHDARSVIAGVLGATELLAQPAVVADGDRPELEQAIIAELTRLQLLLSSDNSEKAGIFDVLDALRPVVRAHAAQAPRLVDDLVAVAAVGHPRATAAALDNVLRNARVHAPDAAVRVFVRRRPGGLVDVVVEDTGPGLSGQQRTEVLARGVRGPRAGAGQGLGLANARRAMEAQHGTLVLDERPGGGLRVTLRLVAAAPVPVAASA